MLSIVTVWALPLHTPVFAELLPNVIPAAGPFFQSQPSNGQSFGVTEKQLPGSGRSVVPQRAASGPQPSLPPVSFSVYVANWDQDIAGV